MRKKIVIILGCLLGLLLIVYLVLALGVGSVVKTAVNRFGPGLAGTAVNLDGAQLSPLSGTGSFDNLVIDNPKGWGSGHAIVLKKITVSAVPSSLFTDHILIRELVIDGAEITYETRLVSSNIGDLVNGIGGKDKNAAVDAKTKSGQPIKFVIQHLVLKNAKVTVGVGSAAVPLTIPDVEYHDVGGANGGLTSTELVSLVGQTLLKNIVAVTMHVASKVGSTVGAAAGDAVKGAGNALENLFKH